MPSKSFNSNTDSISIHIWGKNLQQYQDLHKVKSHCWKINCLSSPQRQHFPDWKYCSKVNYMVAMDINMPINISLVFFMLLHKIVFWRFQLQNIALFIKIRRVFCLSKYSAYFVYQNTQSHINILRKLFLKRWIAAMFVTMPTNLLKRERGKNNAHESKKSWQRSFLLVCPVINRCFVIYDNNGGHFRNRQAPSFPPPQVAILWTNKLHDKNLVKLFKNLLITICQHKTEYLSLNPPFMRSSTNLRQCICHVSFLL